jgi:lysozyme family protein
MTFDDAFEYVVGNEGAFQNMSGDKGNWTEGQVGKGKLKGTKYGISAQSYPTLDIANLSLDGAKAIYKRDFWDCQKFDEYGIPDSVRFDMFDIAVQTCAPGLPHVATVMLQKALGVSSDGSIGPETKTALKTIDAQMLDKRLTAQKILYLTRLDQASWERFGKGWMKRLANNLMAD